MSDQQERRTTCPSRLLTADGRVLTCDHQHSDDRMWEERDDPRAVMHYVCWPDSRIVKHSWPDDDPCAWDADAEGEAVPLRLIGVGSAMRHADGRGHDVLVLAVADEAWFVREARATQNAGWGWVVHEDVEDGEVVVLRAVPPSTADQPLPADD